MFPLSFAFFAFFAWSVGDIFGTVAARRLDGFTTTVWSYILRLVVFATYIPFVTRDLNKYSARLLLLNIILGLVLMLGFFAFNAALRIGNPSVIGTIAAAYTAIVVVFSIVFLHVTLNTSQTIAVLVVFVGVFLTSLDFRALTAGQRLLNRGIALALVAMLCWGTYFTFIKLVVQRVNWFWPNYISFTLMLPLLLFLALKKFRISQPWKVKALYPLLGSVILTGAAEFSFNAAIGHGNSAVVAPIAGSYPVLFVVLAFLVFKEPVTRIQKFGIASALVGVVSLAILSH